MSILRPTLRAWLRTPAIVSLCALCPAFGQAPLKYQMPPKAITDLVDARPTPKLLASPPGASGQRWVIVQYISGLPSIADLAQPELRLAGLRFNPRTNGPSRERYFTALGLQELMSGKEIPVSGLPQNAKIRYVSWAPDARHFAFVNESDADGVAGLSLWIGDSATAQARRIPGVALNAVFGQPFEWLSDSQRLLCRTLVDNRAAAPVRSEIPVGPVVQENLGRVTSGGTYEDLLKSPEDEEIFDYFAASQVRVVRLDGTVVGVGKPGVVASASPSPDARYALIEERHHPYSYQLPFAMFPDRVLVVDLVTGQSRELSDSPLQDAIPAIHDAVPPGPRDFGWRSDAPATISWTVAADGGDPRKEAAIRDTVFTQEASFDATPRKLVELPLRLGKIFWASDRLAFVEELRWRDRKRIDLAVAPGFSTPPVKLFEGSFEDRYSDPGHPYLTYNAAGKPVLQTTPDGTAIYLRGEGASRAGDAPFVATMNVATGETKRVWQSAAPRYEFPYVILNTADPMILASRESPEVSPNFYLLRLADSSWRQITFFPNPYGDAPIPRKEVLRYKRADGVDLSANLYLPPGYKPQDGPLPTLMEAYPTEYKTKDAAGQIIGSPYEFPFLFWGSPIPFVTQGYAVLENATIPIVGEGKSEPNDTYVEQLVASASAAIDEGVRKGVVDRNRVAVMGHSYGAFMTVNLLAHSDLFRAGIARSGAYNRTLTPFGFQNEERTYWQAPQVYFQMSPFSFADKIKAPLLLIHGEADNSSGTFPIQSERLFSAIKGNGGTVRFVLLPLEAHSYQARESVLHMFWEMDRWLNTYVKNAPGPSPTPTQK
jgi:dipeptidyl aminopeptidase/acylaminoacyl peptidase